MYFKNTPLSINLLSTMKRGQTGDADKHAIRRKIEEKQVLIREQRKVRWLSVHVRLPCPDSRLVTESRAHCEII